MLGSLKFAVLQFADFHFPKNPRIARTPCTLSRKTLESPRIYFFYKDCFINPQMIKTVEKIQYVTIILPITAFGL